MILQELGNVGRSICCNNQQSVQFEMFQSCKIYLCGTKKDLVDLDKRAREVDYHMTTDFADGESCAARSKQEKIVFHREFFFAHVQTSLKKTLVSCDLSRDQCCSV